VTLLYDAVALGLGAYGRSVFRVTTLGPRRVRLEPGTLLLVTHRAETDVPVLASTLYGRAGLWQRRGRLERVTFAARDDMFLVGFFAGFPPGLPPMLRARLFPVGVGRRLEGVQVHPLRSATTARLGEALRLRGNELLVDVLPEEERRAFSVRAHAAALPEPLRAADVLRGEYADLLWRPVSPDDPAAAGLDAFWSSRAVRAAADFRLFVDLLRDGGVVLVFPEGRPSPDGSVGPLARGVSALVRRGRPNAVRPVAMAYDPLVLGRTRVTISLGAAVPPPREDMSAAALSLLRRELPLTAGQIVAAGVDASAAVEEAVEVGRPVEPDLLSRDRRRERLAEAAGVASRRPDRLQFLAREYASAREA
jgi:1-acyl-sn-glycerol-3-phosphate acyltransferase